jgi:hypothetical protein
MKPDLKISKFWSNSKEPERLYEVCPSGWVRLVGLIYFIPPVDDYEWAPVTVVFPEFVKNEDGTWKKPVFEVSRFWIRAGSPDKVYSVIEDGRVRGHTFAMNAPEDRWLPVTVPTFPNSGES